MNDEEAKNKNKNNFMKINVFTVCVHAYSIWFFLEKKYELILLKWTPVLVCKHVTFVTFYNKDSNFFPIA